MTKTFLPASRVEGEAGAPWLILSNSLAADMTQWDDVMPHLLSRFRVLRYDARGHGQSEAPQPPEYTIDEMAGDVIRLMDHHGIESAAYMGVSLGGIVGIKLALDHTDRISRVVGACCRADAAAGFVAVWQGRLPEIRAQGAEALVAGNTERWVNAAFRQNRPERLAEVQEMIRRTSTDGLLGCIHALCRFDFLPRVGSISIPILFVAGSEDVAMPAPMMKELAAQVPGAGFEVMEGSAHIPSIDNPEGFWRTVGPFLTQA